MVVTRAVGVADGVGPITPHTVAAAVGNKETIDWIVLDVVSDVDGVDRQ